MDTVRKQASKLREQVPKQQQQQFTGSGSQGEKIIADEAEFQRHQQLGRLFASTRAGKESDQPFKDVLENDDVADAIVSRITEPHSGKGSDELCQWLYESYQAGDPDLQAVVLRFIPTLCGVYYSRTCGDIDEPLAGFEAVLLALHTGEAKARGGRPLLIHLPSLSQPSLYHTPTPALASSTPAGQGYVERLLSAPLEPQLAIKSTKRAAIVGLALELFWRQIAVMPSKSKLEFCQHARRWAVLGCSWGSQSDEIAKLALLPVQPVRPPLNSESVPHLGHALATGESLAVSEVVFEQPPHQRSVEASKAALVERTVSDAVASSIGSQSFNSATSNVEHLGDAVGDENHAVKLPLSLDLLRPIFKVLGHCLVANTIKVEVKEAAFGAARALYVRASEDLLPEAILASRSLVRLGASILASTRTSTVDESPRASSISPTSPSCIQDYWQ